MKAKITKRLVDDARAVGGKPLFVFDSDLAGFVLKVTPAGRKTYQLRYRIWSCENSIRRSSCAFAAITCWVPGL